MTSMLAHDVRRPFSVFRMGLMMLRHARDEVEMRRTLQKVTTEVDRAASTVDGLLADVMEIGSPPATPVLEPVSPEALIETTLGEIFRVYPSADVTLRYSFSHIHKVNVNARKIHRVFANIIANSLQAMNSRGDLWFATREVGGMVEFCLGNAGSSIPPENLPRLFDAFFTSGKAGGTGLGLAIAHKIVTAHGGLIWCESVVTPEYPRGKVEFRMTLPIAEGSHAEPCQLPGRSTEVTRALAVGSPGNTSDAAEMSLETSIAAAYRAKSRPIRIMVVDDESVYCGAIAKQLEGRAALREFCHVVQVASASQALAAAVEPFDLIITDVDLGEDSQNGFELVQLLRARCVGALICVHSNRIVAADHRRALAAGADAFLPKPMTPVHLLRLVLQAMTPRASDDEEALEEAQHRAVNLPSESLH